MRLAHYSHLPLDGLTFPHEIETEPSQSNYWTQKMTSNWVGLDFDDKLKQLLKRLPANFHGAFDGLGEIVKHAKYAGEVLKEYVFEEVRSESFSGLPSRRRCMFLLSMDDYQEAAKGFGLQNYPTTFEVEVSDEASLFLADATLLNCNLSEYDELRQAAHGYWSGSLSDTPQLEYLYVGKAVFHQSLPQ